MTTMSSSRPQSHFNSQPHKEADFDLISESFPPDISTHSLTRRLTSLSFRLLSHLQYFNSQPHKEADLSLCLLCRVFLYFNSQPHKEADDMWTI